MRYCYRDVETGEELELEFPIGQAPEKVRKKGRKLEIDREAMYNSQTFVLKGGGWPSQDIKRKTQMTKLNTEAGHRTRKTWGEPKKVVPNYKGKLTESWREAAEVGKKAKKGNG